ncbi:hypothetical protein SP5_069_01520 [Sphingomonas parapaucimobilis NBRC 15100]|uniref:Uncharacterized protein n=1 Tax=Sphingomonas parapaucimobilis NBRC 15100 TaxID=1219049 RepID=A0A0A1W9B0_9SPHN|nr:hypothetical protein SP5_069_01520 [Sphingomonas parapaucimobilis NBRC 15100]
MSPDMPGIPGKGGVKGRSGRKSLTPGVVLVRHTTLVTPETKRALEQRGPDWVRATLAAALEG